MSYSVIGKKLRTLSFDLEFEFDIFKVIFYDNVYVVCLNLLDNSGCCFIRKVENAIYGVSVDGEIIWRIQDPKEFFGTFSTNTYNLFVSIGQRPDGLGYDRTGSNGSFYALTFCSHYNFDHKTGKIYGGGRAW